MTAKSRYGKTFPYHLPAPNNTVDIEANCEGFMPLIKPIGASRFQNQGSPWDWWDPNSPLATAIVNPGPPPITAHQAALQSNPDMSPTQGRTYVDSIFGYIVPRMVCAMGLDACNVIGVEENALADNSITMFPNPAQDFFTIQVVEQGLKLESVEVLDVTGKLIYANTASSDFETKIQVTGWSAGMYIVRVKTSNGIGIQKLSVR